MDARQSYIDDLQNAWRHDDEHAGANIVPDGTRLTIPMAAMDADQAAIQSHQADAQPELDPEKAIALRNIQADRDRIQAWSDHYDRQRNLRTLADMDRKATPYDEYCRQVSDAWRAA